ncbi:lipopolysaccharide biosynthesis protein [Enterococcus devriesei]|uniref:lipopolysaccharide biosynthesis protein n=1 Tax=Enterococcus devriesei TaxID=319970 RepID=UPI001C11FA01|nr:lipopolysaccharide biosynthesis protein [Enterococcus devriesei]MBU5363900.1 lipopolysaccharide biosynthesis protein [Enterococcus devriesei]
MRFDKSFFKNFGVLLTGSILAQGISIICSPLMTRVFSSESIGIYTYLISVATMFMPVINLRYDMSIVTAKKEDVGALIKGGVVVGAVLSIVVSIGYSIFIVVTQKINLLLTIPFFLLLQLSYSVINTLTSYNNREKNYATISKVTVIRSIIQNLSAFFGLINSSVFTLVSFYTVGQYMGIREQSKTIRNQLKKIFMIPRKQVKNVLIKEKNQALFSTPAIFFNGLSYSIITIFIEQLYGFSSVGYYSMSVRMLGIPMALISGNMSRIFFERATDSYNKTGNYSREFRNVFVILLICAIPLTLFLMMFSPSLFSIFFGEKWRVAGEYVVILAPMFGIRFIVTTMTPALIVVGKQRVEFLLQLLFLVFVIISFVFTNLLGLEINMFLSSISVLFSVGYLLYILFIYKFSK